MSVPAPCTQNLHKVAHRVADSNLNVLLISIRIMSSPGICCRMKACQTDMKAAFVVSSPEPSCRRSIANAEYQPVSGELETSSYMDVQAGPRSHLSIKNLKPYGHLYLQRVAK